MQENEPVPPAQDEPPEDAVLKRVKDVAQRIKDRVKDALKDTAEEKSLSDSTDEEKPLQDE